MLGLVLGPHRLGMALMLISSALCWACLLYWPTNYQQFAVLLPCCAFYWGWACHHVESKLAQPSASWCSGGCSQRQITPQAASGSGQQRPIDRLGRAGTRTTPALFPTQACKNRLLGPVHTDGGVLLYLPGVVAGIMATL